MKIGLSHEMGLIDTPPSLIWFPLIKNLNIIAMAPSFRSHILIQMLSSGMFVHNAVTIFLIKWKFI